MSEIHDTALHRLDDAGHRYTPNRRTVAATLANSEAPMTIAELLVAAPALAQSSTYRNLVVLEEAGVVHKIVTSDEHARYELTEAVTGTHHHHLICTTCGMVIDVTLPDDVEAALHDSLAAASFSMQFRGAHHRVDLLGECAGCAPTSA